MNLKDQLQKFEMVEVRGRHNQKVFCMQRVEASLGVFFLQAFDIAGKKIKNQSAIWGSDTCDAWIANVEPTICGDAAANRFGPIWCDEPYSHKGPCDFGTGK